MSVPVVLFVYNRLDHTENVIRSLSDNILAKETELVIYSDAAKDYLGQEKVKAVRAFINDTSWHENFKSVKIIESKENQGLAKSIINGVGKVIREYGEVIVVEDDLFLSPYFLQYMNDALEFYRRERNIWAISGYSFPMKSLKNYQHDVFYSYRGCSWGWATWNDRWEKVDWEVKDYEKLMSDQGWQKKFNRGGNDLVNMLGMQMRGEISSWAIRWVFAQSNLDMYTVYPKISYVLNDGCDGSGTHCGNDDTYDTDIHGCKKRCHFEKLEIDKKIAHEFWYKYSDTLDKKIKRNLKKYQSLLAYGIFGLFTTAVNIVTYNFCYMTVTMSNTVSNIIAWILAVTFAYLTNKAWVFESRSWKWEVMRKEIPAFISCRLATGVMDLVIMYLSVDVMHWHALVMKAISNVLVIILNYVFSKLVIFKKR